MTLIEQRALLLAMERSDIREYRIRERSGYGRLFLGFAILMAACMIPIYL